MKVQRWKNIFHSNENEKTKASVAILLQTKKTLDKTKTVKEDKESLHIMIKGVNPARSITFINIYAPNIGTPKNVKQMLTDRKRQVKVISIIKGALNTQLISMDKSYRQKVSKETSTLNDTLDQDLIDIF